MVEMNQIYHSRRLSETSDENDEVQLRIPRRRNRRFASAIRIKLKLWFIEYCRITVPPQSFRERGRKVPLPYKINRESNEDFVDGPYEEEIRYFPPSLGMITFSIIELVLYFVNISLFNENNTNSTTNYINPSINGPITKYLVYNPYKRYEAWRFFSYMLAHADLEHVIVNVSVQLLFGVPLELVHRWWRIILIYLAGGLAGSIGSSLTTPNRYLIGASGGAYALLTAHIAVIIMNWSEMEYPWVKILIVIAICACDLTYSLYVHFTDPTTVVSFGAHLCGALTGLLIGIGILRNLRGAQWKRILWSICVMIYFSLICTGILVHVLHSEHFPKAA